MRIAVGSDIKTNQEPRSANPLKTCRFRPIESLEIDHSALSTYLSAALPFLRLINPLNQLIRPCDCFVDRVKDFESSPLSIIHAFPLLAFND